MRILLDECVPRRLKNAFPEHDVQTVPEMGWSSLKNGHLLSVASGRFDAFITTDQRLVSQQNVSKFPIAILVLIAQRNKLEFLLPLASQTKEELLKAKPGVAVRIEQPPIVSKNP